MAIQEIRGSGIPVEPSKNRGSKEEKKAVSSNGDELKLTEQARSLHNSNVRGKEEIQEKIRGGFYFEPEITEKVVDLLLKDLKK